MTSGPASNPGTFEAQNNEAHAQNMILSSFTIYGNLTDRCYATIWHANPDFVKWHVHTADTPADYQTTFNTETQLPGSTDWQDIGK
jgi:hypothetical protein